MFINYSKGIRMLGADEFQPFMVISPVWVVVCVGVFTSLITWFGFLFWVTRHKKQRTLQTIGPKRLAPVDISSIKSKYLALIDQVISGYQSKSISSRSAHQSLSLLARLFIYEVNGHRVDTFTLSDLKLSRYTQLVPVIESIYGPAFDSLDGGDPGQIAIATKEVVSSWN